MGPADSGTEGAGNEVEESENRTAADTRPLLTRRAALGLGGQALALFGLGAFVRLMGGRLERLRPPGALPAEQFLARCIRCQRCVEVCPTGAITSVLLTEGVLGAGTPQMDFHRGYCDLCLECAQVCPTGALSPIDKDAVRIGVAEVDKASCVAWIWLACTKCHTVCPTGAVVLDDQQRPLVDVSKCNGCGLCEYVCVSTAVRSYTVSRGKGIVVRPLSEAQAREGYMPDSPPEESTALRPPEGEA